MDVSGHNRNNMNKQRHEKCSTHKHVTLSKASRIAMPISKSNNETSRLIHRALAIVKDAVGPLRIYLVGPQSSIPPPATDDSRSANCV